MVLKALMVLIIELLVCYLLGVLINKRIIARKTNIIECTLVGFFTYQIMCQFLTLGCYFTTGVVHQLSYTWAVLVVLVSVISTIWCRRNIVEDMKTVQRCISGDRIAFGLLILTVIAFGYYVAINGETNADSQYYIALVNTTASTDTLYKYNPYNGFESDAFFLRRALASFEGHSAILCQLFDIHALVLTRITRAIQNVILTSGAVFLWGRVMFRDAGKNRNKKVCALVIIYLILQFVFSCNYYTNAIFFLKRAYEGKAFTANVALLFALYVSYQYVINKEKKEFFTLLLVLWGSMALSSSAMFLVPLAAVLIIVPYVALELWENKGRKRCRE